LIASTIYSTLSAVFCVKSISLILSYVPKLFLSLHDYLEKSMNIRVENEA
jgi:hypothetical protein